jgi:hypothetical protein
MLYSIYSMQRIVHKKQYINDISRKTTIMTSHTRALTRRQRAAAACHHQVHADFAEAFPATSVPLEPIPPAVQDAKTTSAAANLPNQPPIV